MSSYLQVLGLSETTTAHALGMKRLVNEISVMSQQLLIKVNAWRGIVEHAYTCKITGSEIL